MNTTRKAIRKYLYSLLCQKVDVNNRVFINRDLEVSPLTVSELPAILIIFGLDSAKVISGSENLPEEYERTIELNIMPVVSFLDQETGFDQVDDLEYSISRALYDDWRFASLLSGYDNKKESNDGLLHGSKIVSTDSYIVSNSEIPIAANNITFNLLYRKKAWSEEKLVDFLDYSLDFVDPDTLEE